MPNRITRSWRSPAARATRRHARHAPRALLVAAWLLVSFMVVFGGGEAFVRWQGAQDADGTFQFRGRPIRPYALPVKAARTIVDDYLRSSSSFLVYDADLGWRHRPNARTADGLHRTNAAGLRADRDYAAAMRPGLFRVSMFGDSFVLGSDVDQRDAPAVQLEQILQQRGFDAEVLNFGVGGFGFDQAYLHHRRERATYDTSVVVQGLQLENIGRNVTIFRMVVTCCATARWPSSIIPPSLRRTCRPSWRTSRPGRWPATKPPTPSATSGTGTRRAG
jgi:hypothetical protein